MPKNNGHLSARHKQKAPPMVYSTKGGIAKPENTSAIIALTKGNVNMRLPRFIVTKKVEVPICPVCGEECEMLYRDRNGDYVGCDVCVESKDAWERMEDQRHER